MQAGTSHTIGNGRWHIGGPSCAINDHLPSVLFVYASQAAKIPSCSIKIIIMTAIWVKLADWRSGYVGLMTETKPKYKNNQAWH